MKNVFDYNKKYKLEEVINIIGFILNGTVISQKIFIPLKIVGGMDFILEILLDTYGTQGNYSVLRLKIINTIEQTSESNVIIHIEDNKYGIKPTNLPYSGYFNQSGNSFYGYVPDFNLIKKDVDKFIELNGFKRK